jgi:DNA polymerase III delta prime subunit
VSSNSQFEPYSRDVLEEVDFNKLGSTAYIDDLRHGYEQIKRLIGGEQAKFNKRGYVLLMSGPYGAGKTTAAWALVNELKRTYGSDCIFAERSLIPFGNASESMATFLSSLAQKLWKQRMVDVRNDIKQFIFEVTPALKPYTFEASFGPFSVSRETNPRPVDITYDIMQEKFRRAAKSGKFAVVVLDDLDRLMPEEIVLIMRMVEKLRLLPRVLVLLPVYKDVVTNAYDSIMNLPSDASSTFLRKLTDMQFVIENRLMDLKRVFVEAMDDKRLVAGMRRGELAWFMTLHNMILREAYARASDNANSVEVNRLFGREISPYLDSLRGLAEASRTTTVPEDFPTYPYHNYEEEMFSRLGRKFVAFSKGSTDHDAFNTVAQLSRLRNPEEAMLKIIMEPSLIETLRGRGGNIRISEVENAEAKERDYARPAMMEAFIPRLQLSTEEPLATDNYKLRDVRILAQAIKGDRRFGSIQDAFDLYLVVREHFDRLR